MKRSARPSLARARIATSAPTATKDAPAARYRSASSGTNALTPTGLPAARPASIDVEHGGHDIRMTPAHRARPSRRRDRPAPRRARRRRRPRAISATAATAVADSICTSEADRRRRGVQVVVDAVPPRRPGERRPHAANAATGISHRPHELGGLLGRVDHGHEQVLHAEVEVLLDHHHIADRRAYDRRDGIGRHGVELAEDRLEAVGGVLGVDEHPVEAAAGGDLGDDRAARAHPHADLRTVGCDDARGERLGKAHSNRHVTAPSCP